MAGDTIGQCTKVCVRSKAKFKRYENLGTKADEKEIYRLAEVREKQSKDFLNVWCTKSENKIVLMNDEDVKKKL